MKDLQRRLAEAEAPQAEVSGKEAEEVLAAARKTADGLRATADAELASARCPISESAKETLQLITCGPSILLALNKNERGSGVVQGGKASGRGGHAHCEGEGGSCGRTGCGSAGESRGSRGRNGAGQVDITVARACPTLLSTARDMCWSTHARTPCRLLIQLGFSSASDMVLESVHPSRNPFRHRKESEGRNQRFSMVHVSFAKKEAALRERADEAEAAAEHLRQVLASSLPPRKISPTASMRSLTALDWVGDQFVLR